MKRFTYFDGKKWCLKINDTVYSDFEFIDRMAAYEDTGLTPQEVDEWLYKSYGPLHQKIGRWFDAEKDGRLVVLPCKVLGIVYWIDQYRHQIKPLKILNFEIDYAGICEIGCYGGDYTPFRFYLEDIGKTVFLTREEAEAALKKREEAEK